MYQMRPAGGMPTKPVSGVIRHYDNNILRSSALARHQSPDIPHVNLCVILRVVGL